MLKINAIVSVGSRYGVVVELFEIGQRKLASVHYIDPDTGKLLECPDKARCGNTGHTCPIHSANVDTFTLTPWPVKDVTFYVNEGMICADLARKANAPAIRIIRRKSHVFDIETLEDGMRTRIVKTDPAKGDEWQTALALCNVLPTMTAAAILTDPDSKDYQLFARMFNGHALGGIL